MHMNRRLLLGLMASVAVVTVASTPAAAQETKKPNVVFILADNVGYGDMGPYGGGELRGYPTPRVDQLAREGLRLTQYLVELACAPRARADDGPVFDPQWSLAPRPAGRTQHAAGQGVHDGAVVQGFGLRDGHVRQVAPRHRSAEPARRARLRRVLRHPAGHLVGRRGERPADHANAKRRQHPREGPDREGALDLSAEGERPSAEVKPFTLAVRAEIDTRGTAARRSIEFIKRQAAAGKPFFLDLPFSMGHAPNLPSKQFAGKSRISLKKYPNPPAVNFTNFSEH